ncbi:putative reverse transcriptase domain-containing protein [Tanacetum coccineum]
MPVLSPAPPPSPIRSLGYRTTMIRLRAKAASTSHSLPLPPPFILSPTRLDAPSSGIPPPLPISVPTSSLPLLLPSASHGEDIPAVTLPPRKRLGIALGLGYELTIGYGITDSWDEIVETLQGAPVSTDTELGRHMTVFETRVRQDTDEIYTRLDDEQSQRQLLAGRLNMLFRDRRAHVYIRIVTTLQGQVTALRDRFTALQGQQGPVGGPAQPELPEEAGVREMPTMLYKSERPLGQARKPTYFECRVQGHFKRECPKLKNNKNLGNQLCKLSQSDITPSTLDDYYDIELADGRIIGLNTILRACTLNLLNHPFNINLMLVELGSFNAIIGMDWLAKYQEIIVCAKKIVRIPWGNETLIVHDDKSNRGHEARLHIISYSKIQEYMLKGCQVFLAHVTTNEVEDKSEKKRLEDVPIV